MQGMQATAFDRALDLLEQNRVDDALPVLEDLHAQNPKDARVNFSLAMAARDAGEDLKRLEYLKKAAAVAKKKGLVFEELARAHLRFEEFSDAIAAARRAVMLEPENPAMYAVLGEVYFVAGRMVMAEQNFKRALELQPDHIYALTRYGDLKFSLGDQAQAEKLLRQAISSPNGDASLAFVPLSQINSRERNAQDIPMIERAIAEMNDTPKARGRIHFAAAAMWDDAGNPAKAFEHFDKGHELIYPSYEVAAYKTSVNHAKRLFTPEFFEERRHLGFETDKPVFVVGMPRSGTTLTEQIINRHPRAFGAGELTFFERNTTGLEFGRIFPRDFEKNILEMTEKDFKRIGRKYLALLNERAPGADRVVDKLPHNFERLWLLSILFPNATFIHCTREPIDCCISIYTKPMSQGHRYAYSQETLGEYYRYYMELMAHLHSVLPVTIRDQSYEAMVADQEAESRALIAHAGLEWDDACLEFYKGEGTVRTFSRDQVRRPIYKTSVERWRKYEGQVGPLLEALGDLAPQTSHVKSA